MASAAHTTAPPLPAVQRYFEVSLFLLVATGVLAIVSTGKLDIISVLIPSVALIYKGIRMQRGRGPEITPRLATWLVIGYFLFFPLDLWVLSRGLAESAPESAAVCRAAFRDSPDYLRDARPPVLRALQSRLRFSRRARRRLNAGFRDSYRRRQAS